MVYLVASLLFYVNKLSFLSQGKKNTNLQSPQYLPISVCTQTFEVSELFNIPIWGWLHEPYCMVPTDFVIRFTYKLMSTVTVYILGIFMYQYHAYNLV